MEPGHSPGDDLERHPGPGQPELFLVRVDRPAQFLPALAAGEGSGEHANVDVAPTDGSPGFRNESTWCVKYAKDSTRTIVISPASAPDAWLYVPGVSTLRSIETPASWFVEVPQVPTPFDRHYNADKQIQAKLGKPAGDPVLTADVTGYRPYEKGRIYLTRDNGRATLGVVYNGPVLDKLLAVFGNTLLQQTVYDQYDFDLVGTKGQALNVLRPADKRMLHVAWSQQSGAHEFHGEIANRWQPAFGYPTTDESASPSGGVLYNHFTTASIYYLPAQAGTRVVTGEIHKKYAALNYESGPLGNPVTEATPFGSNGGVVQRFDGGSIYYTPANGAMAVYGAIGAKYAEFGKETGILGYPVADTAKTADGKGEFLTLSNGARSTGPLPPEHTPSTAPSGTSGSRSARRSPSWASRPATNCPCPRAAAAPSPVDGSTTAAKAASPSPTPRRGDRQGCRIQRGPVEPLHPDRRSRRRRQGRLRRSRALGLLPAAPKQIWDVVDLGGSKYALKNRNSGKCLDLYAAGADNGANIAQYTCHYGAAQQWEITTAPGSAVALRNVASGKVIEAAGNQTGNATLVQQWMDLVHPNQQWTIIPV